MGVSNLWSLLEPCGRRIDVKALRGKRVAIALQFLKRQTVAERRRRRDQQEARVKKTAEKLLLNRLKQHALAQAAAQGQQIQQRAPTANPTTNTITTAPTTATAAVNEQQQQNNDNEAGPSTSRPRETTDNPTITTTTTTTTGVITAADFTIEDSESDSELFDFEPMLPEGETIDPVVLATLPPSVQLEVMLRLRDRQHAANRGGFEERTGKPEEFSQFQINQYLKTSNLRRQLDTLRGAGAAANGAPRPVAAEEAVEYVLERDEPEVVEPEQAGEGSQPVVSPTAAAGAAASRGIDLSFEIGKDEVLSDDGSLGWEDIEDDNPATTPGSGGGGEDGGGGEGTEHWRERAARRQKYWSLSHGFQMGRKLAQWGEGEEPQQRGRSPPAGEGGAGVGAAGGVVNEDEDAQLQEAIRLSLVDNSTQKDHTVFGGQPAVPVSMPRSGFATMLQQHQQPGPSIEPKKAAQKQFQQVEQQKQRQQVGIVEEVALEVLENEEEMMEQQEIPEHPEFVPPPTAAAAPAAVAAPPIVVAQVQEEQREEEIEVDEEEPVLPVEEEKQQQEEEEEEREVAVVVTEEPEPVQPSPSSPPAVVKEEEAIAEEELILPAKQAAKPALPQPKVVRFAEPEASEAPLPSPPPPQQLQEEIIEDPSPLPPSSQHEAAQFEGLLASAWPEEQQQQQQQQPQPLDHATLRREEASLRAEHRAAAGQSDTPTDIMFAECQELLQLFGLPYLIAPSEAEAQAAWLDAAGLVDGVVTDDNDAFLFGARRLYRNIFEEAKYVEEYRTDELESELGLNRERLVNLALLLGSDYTAGVAGVGVVNAVEIVRAFEGEHGLEKFAKWMKDVDEEIVKLAKLSAAAGAAGGASGSGSGAEDDSNETEFEKIFMKKHKNARKTWNLPSGFPSSEVVAAYLAPKVDNSKEKFTFARPDLDLLRHFCAQKFGWEQVRTDELLLPVLKAYDERQTQQTLDNFIAHRTKFAKIRSKRLREAVAGITGQDNEDLALNDELLPPSAKKSAAPKQRKNAKKKGGADEAVEKDDDGEVIFVEETPAPGTRGRGRGRGRGRTNMRRSRAGQQQQKAALEAAEAAEEEAAAE